MIDATAPASVGVITPAMMPTITASGISAGASPSTSTFDLRPTACPTPDGSEPLPKAPHRKITIASATTIRMPGTMPAMNSGPIGCTATTP